MNERDERCQQEQRRRCLNVQPRFGSSDQGEEHKRQGRHGLPAVRAPHGGWNKGRSPCAISRQQGWESQIDDQEQRSVQVDGQHHPPVMFGEQSVREHDLPCKGQGDGRQVCADQPRGVAPAGRRTRGCLGHDSPTQHRLSITSATSGRLVLIQPPCPSTHLPTLAFDGADAVDKG